MVHTKTVSTYEAYDKRNLVVVSRFDLSDTKQYRNDLVDELQYKRVTARPKEDQAKEISFGRPILHTQAHIKPGFVIHLINLHLKSRIPTDIPGQQHPTKDYIWKSAYGWAEGYFLSAIKRVGQALETRILVDRIFDENAEAKIVVCGDFNAHPDEVPVEAISGRTENTSNPELLGRVLASCEYTIPESARFTYLHQGQKRLLDHMLISRSMLQYYRKAEIHNETLHDEGLAFAYDTKFPESDHAPFIAEFKIPD